MLKQNRWVKLVNLKKYKVLLIINYKVVVEYIRIFYFKEKYEANHWRICFFIF